MNPAQSVLWRLVAERGCEAASDRMAHAAALLGMEEADLLRLMTETYAAHAATAAVIGKTSEAEFLAISKAEYAKARAAEQRFHEEQRAKEAAQQGPKEGQRPLDPSPSQLDSDFGPTTSKTEH